MASIFELGRFAATDEWLTETVKRNHVCSRFVRVAVLSNFIAVW